MLGRVMGLPWILIRVAVSSLWVVSSLSLSLITILGNRLIPPRALRAARRVVTSLQGSGAAQDNDPSAQARSFAQQFASSYLRSNQNSGASTAAASAASSSAAAANEGPRFVEVGARQAMQLARSQHKFTFVYLHAPGDWHFIPLLILFSSYPSLSLPFQFPPLSSQPTSSSYLIRTVF